VPSRPPGHRRGGRSLVRCLTVLTLVGLLSACGPPDGHGEGDLAAPTGRLSIGDTTIAVAVTGCATIGDRFSPVLPVEGAETTLTATGLTEDQEPVAVVVRRTRSAEAPHVVESVEIGIGDPERRIEALVLYRAFDEDTDRWIGIDPDAATTRIDVDGPLLTLEGGQVRATGVARRAPSGAPVVIGLEADCPIDPTEGPGLA
jgi:hypothetical protein